MEEDTSSKYNNSGIQHHKVQVQDLSSLGVPVSGSGRMIPILQPGTQMIPDSSSLTISRQPLWMYRNPYPYYYLPKPASYPNYYPNIVVPGNPYWGNYWQSPYPLPLPAPSYYGAPFGYGVSAPFYYGSPAPFNYGSPFYYAPARTFPSAGSIRAGSFNFAIPSTTLFSQSSSYRWLSPGF
jgi:hypothetical protein